jgi:uncharacterized protein YecE (DUF72 family)
LNCVEINSSFYRSHAETTYAKWRDSTPAAFRFAVKVPRTITHERGLENVSEPLTAFLGQSAGLAEKRGPLLVQLPPSRKFEETIARRFFELVRTSYEGPLVCEPRHATWFTPVVESLLEEFAVARVAADPPPVPPAADPAAWSGIAYYRLHGSPRKYWSTYSPEFLAALAATIGRARRDAEIWCVFDNTASGAAIANALELTART